MVRLRLTSGDSETYNHCRPYIIALSVIETQPHSDMNANDLSSQTKTTSRCLGFLCVHTPQVLNNVKWRFSQLIDSIGFYPSNVYSCFPLIRSVGAALSCCIYTSVNGKQWVLLRPDPRHASPIRPTCHPRLRSDLKHCNPISAIFPSSNYIPLGKASQLNKWLYFDIHNYTHSHKIPFQVKYAFYYTLIICDEIMHSVGLDRVRVHLIE